jgi:hypothetical protein
MTQVLTLPPLEAFRTAPLLGLPTAGRVDHEAGKIFGAKALQVGPLNAGDSRPYKVDSVSLDQLEQLVAARQIGTKVRFSHPNMSRDGMGRHLGRAANARRVADPEGDYTAVDITLSKAATRSPSGDLFSYVLDLAEQTPEDFGLSLAPLLDRAAMDKMQPDANGLIPIRLKGLSAIDVVDDPAATRGGLFSIESEAVADLPGAATKLLDTYFADASADVIRGRLGEFLTTYLQHRGDDEMSTTDTKPTEKTPAPDHAAELASLKSANAQLEAANKALSDKLSAGGKADDQAAARAELDRIGQIEALCTLAGVDAAKKDLILKAGFSRAEASDYLAKSGFLAGKNPPIGEGGTDLGEKKLSDDDKFGAEFDANKDLFARQGLTREAYVKSRKKG